MVIEIKQLTEKDIPQVINLSTRIFDPILQGLDKNEDKNIWVENFHQNGLILGAYSDGVLTGFVFFFEKEKGVKSIHCWMVGVDEAYRRKGILKSLMETGRKELRERGYEFMTLNSFNEKLPEMSAYLHRYDFIEYKQELKDWHGKQTTKSFFRKKL